MSTRQPRTLQQTFTTAETALDTTYLGGRLQSIFITVASGTLMMRGVNVNDSWVQIPTGGLSLCIDADSLPLFKAGTGTATANFIIEEEVH